MTVETAEDRSNLWFIQSKFREYYWGSIDEIDAPSDMERREFGFFTFNKKPVRHKSFKTIGQLRDFIKVLVPSDAYYSSAYYQKPDAETMGEKNWMGADLIFDVDCDHLPTTCKAEHDEWRCTVCGRFGRGRPPTRCPECGGERLKADMWICDKCLEATKQELLKLICILEEDFGISDREMFAVFSGHRGYHLHVESDTVKSMSSIERKEVVDYVTATGLNPVYHGVTMSERPLIGPSPADIGWGGRLARAIYTLALKTPQELKEAGVDGRLAKMIENNRGRIIEAWERGGVWASLREFAGPKTLERILSKALTFMAASVDTVVTTDIHRLIRLPTTLHGKTGLKVIAMPIHKLAAFEPLRDAIAFTEGDILVKVYKAPKIRLGGHSYGPFLDEEAVLPSAVAIFLICRNKASPL
ncbi:MAG: DNA primase small subunit PriS [Candidatus Bathyarchaeia archaeon]